MTPVVIRRWAGRVFSAWSDWLSPSGKTPSPLRNLARIALTIRQSALDRFQNLGLWRRAVLEHALPETTLRSDELTVEQHIELAEFPFFDDHQCPETPAQLGRQLFGASVIATWATVENVEFHDTSIA